MDPCGLISNKDDDDDDDDVAMPPCFSYLGYLPAKRVTYRYASIIIYIYMYPLFKHVMKSVFKKRMMMIDASLAKTTRKVKARIV